MRKILLLGERDLLEQKGLADLLEHLLSPVSHLSEHAIRQACHTEHVDVHDPVARVQADNLPLRLHRRLLRHKDKEATMSLPKRFLYDLFVDSPGLT